MELADWIVAAVLCLIISRGVFAVYRLYRGLPRRYTTRHLLWLIALVAAALALGLLMDNSHVRVSF